MWGRRSWLGTGSSRWSGWQCRSRGSSQTRPTYARALASTGPAFEAIQQIGEEAFLRDAQRLAEEHVRGGLHLRAEINVTAFLARRPLPLRSGPSYLTEPEILSAPAQAMRDQDVAEVGYVMNSSRLWALDADGYTRIFDILGDAATTAGLSVRDRGILVAATAATLGDSYCALSWGWQSWPRSRRPSSAAAS